VVVCIIFYLAETFGVKIIIKQKWISLGLLRM